MKIQKSELTIIGIIVFFYFSFSLLNCSQITEDAFIYFRFVENLANGYGYVFNPGERVEGCSSVIWFFLLTFFYGLGCNILTTSKVLGILFGSISLFLIFQITKHYTVRMPWVILPSLLTSFSLPFIMWNQMGLETSLSTMIFLIIVLICLNNNLFIYWPIIALILILTRPEGMFLLLGLIPVLYFQKGKKVIISILLFVILWLIVMLIRFIYFHDFLPSPFYFKMYEDKYLSGFKYIHLYFKDHYIYYFCAPLLYILLQKFNWQKERIILFGFIVVYLAWIILGGSEPNPYYRHAVTLIPLLYIYLITGIERVIGEFSPIKKVLISIYITTFCVVTLFFPIEYWRQNTIENPIAAKMQYFISNPFGYLIFCLERLQNPKEFNYVGASQRRQLLIGELIKRNYPSGTTLLYDQMGRTPYQAGINYCFIDSLGLTDVKIGRYYFMGRIKASPFLRLFESITSSLIEKYFPQTKFINSRKEAINYIFRQRKPDVIMVHASVRWNKECLPFWLINDKLFRNLYERKYLIEDTLVFEKRGFGKRLLNIPDGLSIIYNEDDVWKALNNFGSNKIALPSLKDQIDNVISKHKNVLTLASTSANKSQADPKSEMQKTGRWRRSRTLDHKEKDEQLFSRLIALGYLQGYNPAPQSKNVTVYNKDRTYNGFNFYISGHAPEAFLIDMNGNNVHQWHYKNAEDIWPSKRKDSNGSFWRRAHLYKNGDLLAVYEGTGLIKIDKDSQLLWAYSGHKQPHHDLEVLEDGTIYVLTREYKVIPRINNQPVFEDFITILTPEGKAKKHISLLVLLEESDYARLRDEDSIGFYGDIMHTNTLEVFDGKQVNKSHFFKKGNVMVSSLILNTIFIIDMDSEMIEWSAGSGMWKRQHQPTLLDNGHILIFDNHYTKKSSQIIEYQPFTQKIVWHYRGNDKDEFFSLTCGSNQRLPNGNTLITETDFGRVFEVGMDSGIVWEFISPYTVGDNNEWIATIPEMIRIEPEFVLFLDCIDTDEDGYGDPTILHNTCQEDNCPYMFNPNQTDSDGDCIGDACDPFPNDFASTQLDTDNDGIGNTCDNCSSGYNPSQEDNDNDGMGDVCDHCPHDPENDVDNDSVCGDVDNCPKIPNPLQEDTYPPQGNDIGDACDCEGDFNCDGSVNAVDSSLFLKDFDQRTKLDNPCTNKNQCNGDFDCDGDVDENDRTIFQTDFGRGKYKNSCPQCSGEAWCLYE